jgi:methylphosphotriester-DNA--protein-cysteine methyltransferase
MITHLSLGNTSFKRSRHLHALIKNGQVILGGNSKLKIYGSLQCKSGKRMKVINRVFFATEEEAIAAGYRPCGHCMKNKYNEWNKNKSSKT